MTNHRWLLGVGLVCIAAGIASVALARKPTITRVQLASQTLTVQHADTPQEQERGLMGWCSLKLDQGMLFDFVQPTQATFWMKGMRMAIDIVWVRNGQVIGWESNLQPDNGRRLYLAPALVDHVLELPAGWAESHDLQLGDSFQG